MKNSLLDAIKDTESSRDKILAEFHRYFDSMKCPAGFTVNFHPKIRRRINGLWKSTDLEIAAIDQFWNALNGEFLHMNYYSYERKMSRQRVLGFGNVEYGSLSNNFHIHGVVDNFFRCEGRLFHYMITSAIKSANNLCRIVSGNTHIDLCVDIRWVGYVFKDNTFCYPLIAK